MASFPNVYTHRKVADTASKACEICFKPSTSVLVTPENKVQRRYTELTWLGVNAGPGLLLCMPGTPQRKRLL
jgi:hypothetical protein